MKTILHRSEDRGNGDHAWLKSRFSFSFAHWYEPTRMGFGALRVINDDTIAPASGFGAHSHSDMEIITIVMQGAVTHKDSIGNSGRVPAGDVQVMSAGTGVTHAELNESPDEELRLFQIWILPERTGSLPRYDQKSFPEKEGATLLVGPTEDGGALSIQQQAYITRLRIPAGEECSYDFYGPGTGAYVFVVSGTVQVAGEELGPRDALGVTNATSLAFTANEMTEILVIEVPV